MLHPHFQEYLRDSFLYYDTHCVHKSTSHSDKNMSLDMMMLRKTAILARSNRSCLFRSSLPNLFLAVALTLLCCNQNYFILPKILPEYTISKTSQGQQTWPRFLLHQITFNQQVKDFCINGVSRMLGNTPCILLIPFKPIQRQ